MDRGWSRRQLLKTALGGSVGVTLGGGLLAACGGDDDDASPSTTAGETPTTAAAGTPTTAATATPTTVAATTPTTAAAATPVRGGVLRIAMVGGGTTDSVDPNTLLNSLDFARNLQLFESLTFRDYEWNVINLLAEEIEPGASADQWTIRLREGIEFHHGKTLTVDDVIFSIERNFNPAGPGLGFTLLGDVIDPAQITKVDDRTMTLQLLKPFSVLPQFLGLGLGIVPTDFDVANPVGTGPWKFKSFVPGDRSVFERFENYWDGPAYADSLEIINFADSASASNALQAGQIDIAVGVDFAQISTLEAAGMQLLRTQSNAWDPFVMNAAVAPFDDPRVRQAFRLMVDREQMVAQVLQGYGRVANDLYSPTDPSYLSSAPQRTQDIEKAKALLAEAGVSDLTLDLASVPIDSVIPAMVQVFAQQAKEAGVTINVQNVTPDQFFTTVYFQSPLQPDFWANESYMLDTRLAQIAGGPYNSGNYIDPELEELYTAVLSELDVDKRIALQQQMQEIQHERGNLIIWGFTDVVDALAPNVNGLVPDTKTVFSLNDGDTHRVWLS